MKNRRHTVLDWIRMRESNVNELVDNYNIVSFQVSKEILAESVESIKKRGVAFLKWQSIDASLIKKLEIINRKLSSFKHHLLALRFDLELVESRDKKMIQDEKLTIVESAFNDQIEAMHLIVQKSLIQNEEWKSSKYDFVTLFLIMTMLSLQTSCVENVFRNLCWSITRSHDSEWVAITYWRFRTASCDFERLKRKRERFDLTK